LHLLCSSRSLIEAAPHFTRLLLQGGSERHDFHHSHFLGSYGSFFCFWDWLCGTDVPYRAHQLGRVAFPLLPPCSSSCRFTLYFLDCSRLWSGFRSSLRKHFFQRPNRRPQDCFPAVGNTTQVEQGCCLFLPRTRRAPNRGSVDGHCTASVARPMWRDTPMVTCGVKTSLLQLLSLLSRYEAHIESTKLPGR
jgi:hypothetical protein